MGIYFNQTEVNIRCTVKAGTARGFRGTRLRTSGARQDGAAGAILLKTDRTKKEMEVYPSDLECFVQRKVPIKDWPY